MERGCQSALLLDKARPLYRRRHMDRKLGNMDRMAFQLQYQRLLIKADRVRLQLHVHMQRFLK